MTRESNETNTDDDIDDALADAYNQALALEKAGKLDEAAEAYGRVLELDKEDFGGASVRLASMGKGPVPDRAPPAYVCTLFNQHADMFDKILVEDLGYQVPTLAAKMLNQHVKQSLKNMLDLGCGTGLMGLSVKHHMTQPPMALTGIDLADNMLDIAYEHDVYDTLYVDDVERFLSIDFNEEWDLICAMDVLPYLGDLKTFTKGVADRLMEGGYAIFSTETLPEDAFGMAGFTVGRYQRFAHHLDYIKNSLNENGLQIVKIDDITVRHEQGMPIFGHLVLVEKPKT